MAEYERSRHIRVSPGDVFAFVSDVGNLPTFVPTVSAVEPQADGRIRVRGEVHDIAYEDDGWFNVEEARRRLEWRVEEREYAGWLTVAGDDGGTEVVMHLSVAPYVTPSGQPITREMAAEADPVEQSLEAALDSLRNLMEGLGGKEEPAGMD